MRGKDLKNFIKVTCLFSLCYLSSSVSAETTSEKLKLDIHIASKSISSTNKRSNLTKKKKKKFHGFTGEFGLKGSLKNGDISFTNSVTFKPNPKDFWYVKVGGKYEFDAESDRFSYSWGVGYDDWHEGTWTAQINHWGGIRPGQGIDHENSYASLAYKIKSDALKSLNLKSTLGIAKQLQGGSDTKLSASLQWSPKEYWFIKAILIKPFNGDDAKWNYLFGYDDWHPNTFAIEYSNYDSNDLFETNFKKHGQLALRYKWKF